MADPLRDLHRRVRQSDSPYANRAFRRGGKRVAAEAVATTNNLGTRIRQIPSPFQPSPGVGLPDTESGSGAATAGGLAITGS